MASNNDDPDEILAQARRGVARAAGELELAGRDLDRPWPRVPADVLAEGRAAVGRAAAALRGLAGQLDAAAGRGDVVPEAPCDSHP